MDGTRHGHGALCGGAGGGAYILVGGGGFLGSDLVAVRRSARLIIISAGSTSTAEGELLRAVQVRTRKQRIYIVMSLMFQLIKKPRLCSLRGGGVATATRTMASPARDYNKRCATYNAAPISVEPPLCVYHATGYSAGMITPL